MVYNTPMSTAPSSIQNLTVSRETTDSVVFSVVRKFLERSAFGFRKYGTNLDRQDLSVLDWIQHAQEEHMDAILYLEKLKQEVSKASSFPQGRGEMVDSEMQTPEKLIESSDDS